MATRKPDPKKLSPKDRVATTTHLAQTIQYNALHSYNHAKSAAQLARKIKEDPNGETIRHNAEHALKHAKDVKDHARKLISHLQTTYPGADAAYQELMNPKPSAVPSRPSKKS